MASQNQDRLFVSGRLPDPNMVHSLQSAGFAPKTSSWIQANIVAGTYTHYAVTKEWRDYNVFILIDTFYMYPFVNSETGQKGESPHGTLCEYIGLSGGNWKLKESTFYGG